MTPWGALRQYVDVSGKNVTRFEDLDFSEMSFVPSMAYAPATPISLSAGLQRLLPAPHDPLYGCDAELYVVEGYAQSGNAFAPEQEHYLGGAESEEFDDSMMM